MPISGSFSVFVHWTQAAALSRLYYAVMTVVIIGKPRGYLLRSVLLHKIPPHFGSDVPSGIDGKISRRRQLYLRCSGC